MSTLSKSTSPTLVKTLFKVVKPLDANTLSWNFGHVLQILSKHSKTYQCKTCAEFSGTHFIFRLAFQILRGKGSNLQVKPAFTIHRSHENQQVHQQFMLQSVVKTCQPL
jgi:O-acetylhomoserine/O-acetylserine sulfhydrylase-like pyridoxal-dependent enzyme